MTSDEVIFIKGVQCLHQILSVGTQGNQKEKVIFEYRSCGFNNVLKNKLPIRQVLTHE